MVDRASAADRDLAFDALKLAIGTAVAADRTLGGTCDYALGEAPAPVDLPIDGAEGMKAATIGIVLAYATEDPLNDQGVSRYRSGFRSTGSTRRPSRSRSSRQ